jgi:tetratricopeptide (TPR) repeat protein
MKIASREKPFADQLLRLGLKKLGGSETQMIYASLAENARQEQDLDAAGQYLLQAVDIDPSQIAAGFILVDIAKTNRARADKLIVDYLDRLRHFPLSRANGSIFRIYMVVDKLVFPPLGTEPPGPVVMRAYVSYVTESFASLEDREPGSLKAYRPFLSRAWLPLKQYAPDLTTDFMILEQRSRQSNDIPSLPMAESQSPDQKNDYEKRVKDATESDQPNEVIINRAINRGDFTKARKLIDKLSDGLQKTQLTEIANAKEALYVLTKNDLIEARRLAEKLKQASSIREVYPALIGKCVSDKDQTCAASLMVQAMKQLKSSDTIPWTPLAGTPTAILTTNRDFDPILEGMAKLTLAVVPISYEIALIGLGETVAAANVSQLDTAQGRVGFDVSIFKKLAPKNESRVRQEAESFKDSLRRIISLVAIYQWKAADFDSRLAMKNRQIKETVPPVSN